MCCYFAIIESQNTLKKYSCHEVRKNHHEWKREFREENQTDLVEDDKAYHAFCDQIDLFLAKCTHKDDTDDSN